MSLSGEDRAWIAEQLQANREDITQQLHSHQVAIEEQLRLERAATTEQIRGVETALLTEFHRWASPNEARQRTHAAALRAIDLEMESLSNRVTKLEGGPTGE